MTAPRGRRGASAGAAGTRSGRIRRVNGPLIEVEDLPGLAMFEVVEAGLARIPGEVVAIRGSAATIQAYEYTGGLSPGEPAAGTGGPLSARLGPHLLGGVFDGLLRPLSGAPAWLEPGRTASAGGEGRRYRFTPRAREGAAVGAGDCLGTVAVPGRVDYQVLVPPGVSGEVAGLHPAGLVAGEAVIARVAGASVPLTASWPVRQPRPFLQRLPAADPLATGQRVVDVLFPVARGGAAAVPGGFGTGKTVLLQQIAKWCDADVIVYVGCGERGNELADLLDDLAGLADPRGGGRLADRTVVIANTSNMPMMARESSIYTGAAVAEHFRDMGLDVVVVADSTSRWAEALREFASRGGELPAEEGYPASLASALAAFYERAGRVVTLGGRSGSVTIIGAVSPPGSDMTEPVTAFTQRFVRSLWSLDRDLAYARHYPAVSWSGSFCRDAAAMGAWHAREGDAGWAGRRSRLAGLLAEADRAGALAELMGATALPGPQRVALLAGRLVREGVLQQSALSAVDGYCGPERAAALADAVLAVADRCQELVSAGAAPERIEGQDFGPVLRAREEAPSAEQVAARAGQVLARLDTLARERGPSAGGGPPAEGGPAARQGAGVAGDAPPEPGAAGGWLS